MTFIGSPAQAQLNPGFWAAGNSLTHSNNVIKVGGSLLTAELSSTLTLGALNPVNTGLPGDILPPLVIDIKFKETPNSGACAVNPFEAKCPDIFTVAGGALNTSFFYDVDGTGAQQYFVNIFPSSGGVLGPLPANVCAAAGEAAGCIGFTTEEKKENTPRVRLHGVDTAASSRAGVAGTCRVRSSRAWYGSPPCRAQCLS